MVEVENDLYRHKRALENDWSTYYENIGEHTMKLYAEFSRRCSRT